MRFWHVGIMVRDLDAAIAYYKGLPGAESEWPILRNRSFTADTCIVGDPSTIDIAFGKVGGLTYELIQPVSNYSMQAEAIKNRGEHIHHMAYVCGDELQATVDGLLATGATKIWENNDGFVHVVFVKAKDGGMIFELSDVHPDDVNAEISLHEN